MRHPGGVRPDELQRGTCSICNRHMPVYIDDQGEEVCMDCAKAIDAYTRTEGYWSMADRREAV